MNKAYKVNIDPKMESKDLFNIYFDKAFDDIYDAIDAPSMSLLQIIENIKLLKFTLDPKLVQIVIQKRLDHHLADYRCPACGKQLHEKYTQLREVATTVGTLSFSFPYLRCPSCKTNHTPYEDALNLKRGKYQYDVQKLAARMASGETFEKAAGMLNEIYRFGISPDTVHALTNDLADEIQLSEILPTPEELLPIIDEISKDKKRRPVFVFTVDGAMAPIRTEELHAPNCWKEVKGIRGYLIDQDQIVHVLSWHQIASKQDFLHYLIEIKDKNIIPADKVRLCFIGDGAQWIWDLAQQVFPGCREVLDYYHCSEHLHAFAKLHFGEGKSQKWLKATKDRLFHSGAALVIAGLKRIKCRSPEAEKNRGNLVGYLTTHQNRIDYGKCRRGG
ncbi:MAG: ISKra4 family transposase, partial [Rectinemataceae bacterium]|nr:ISKra4 family transposase [Rectinemataceae bacterium]